MRANFAQAAALLSLIILSAGCANKPPPSNSTQPQGAPPPVVQPQAPALADCTWPGTTQPAPGWTCDEPVAGIEVSAVGIYGKTAAGLQFQKDQAAAAARVALAQQMRIHVTDMVKRYAETTGSASSETVDQVNASVSKLLTNETLQGSRVFKSAVAPNGDMFVLVGFDPKQAALKTQEILKSSMNSDRAAWQRVKAKEADSELAAAIAAADKQKSAGQ